MINSMGFAKRLRFVMDHYKLSASSFAERIGVQRSGISHILAGRNKPSLDFVLKIIQEFDEVDLYWLLIGKGSFPPTPQTEPKPQQQNIANDIPDIPKAKVQIAPDHIHTSTNREKNNNCIAKIIILYENGSFDSFEN